MALALMGGWIRSHAICDRVFLGIWDSYQYLESRRGCIAFERINPWFFGDSLKWESTEASKQGEIEYHEASRYAVWRWTWGGFACGANAYKTSWTSWYYVIPYWSIAVPLTLLSAYLIFWKPRKAK